MESGWPRGIILITTFLQITACSDSVMLPPDHVLPDGSVYQGEIEDGLFHGYGELAFSDGASYKGEFKEGLMSGQGIYIGTNDTKYQGEFENGGANGFIIIIDKSEGYRYSGSVKNWVHHGQGTITYDAGNSYVGEFEDGEFNGQGVYKTKETVYEGEFIDGVLSGTGTITEQDGEIYIGEVKDWFPNGEGKKTDAVGNIIIGNFESGYANGKGKYIGADGSQYEGEFSYGEFDGEGVLVNADLSSYSGEFSYGKYHGKGTLVTPATEGAEQKILNGKWRSGKLVHNYDTGVSTATQAEVALENHQSLLNEVLSNISPSEPDKITAYFLGVAGDGTQSVFRREVEFVNDYFEQHFGAKGRAIKLINHHDSADLYPLATSRSITAAVTEISKKMDLDNDVLVMYLSSHGSKKHKLKLSHDSIKLPDLSAKKLAKILSASGIKWKVVMVSACYAGGFIPKLEDETTMIITAADAQNTSFGCSEESEMTYFGRALFKEVLTKTPQVSFPDAFKVADSLIKQWEEDEELSSSNPKIKAPTKILDHLKKFRQQSMLEGK